MADDLIFRLRERARIRRLIPDRKSVQEGTPDRIADLFDEAADALAKKHNRITLFKIAIMSANMLAALVADSIYEFGGATAPAIYAIVFLNIGSIVLLTQRRAVL